MVRVKHQPSERRRGPAADRNWHLYQATLKSVFYGGTTLLLDRGFSSFSVPERRRAPLDEDDAAACDPDLCRRSPGGGREEKRRRPATPPTNTEGSVTTSGESR